MTAEFTLAVHALEYLCHTGDCRSSEQIAENACTNPARVRKVLSKLEKHGIVTSKNGACGGYFLSADPDTLNLEQILTAVGQTLLTSVAHSGHPHMDCLIASGMADVMDSIFGQAETAGRGVLSKITLRDVDGMVFSRKKEA